MVEIVLFNNVIFGIKELIYLILNNNIKKYNIYLILYK